MKQQPLNLAIVGIKWPPETFIQRKLSTLVERGIEVTVATSVSRKQRGFSIPGVKVFYLPNTDDFILSNLARFSWNLVVVSLARGISQTAKLLRLQSWASPKVAFARTRSYLALARIYPDVVHFEWNSAAISNLPMFDVWNCPIIISCRGSQINIAPHNPQRYSIREGLQTSFQRAAAIHCVSDAIKQEALEYGLDTGKAWVIRPAVDPNFFYPPAGHQPGDLLRIITTSSLVWLKGYEYALLAIREMIDQGFRLSFSIIGDGPEKQRLLYTIQDLGLQEHVHLLGKLSPTDVRDRLQEADVFLLSSLSEGISNAVLEAMACGLPVVTTNCGGMEEAVEDGIEGFVVPMRQPERIAEAIGRLANDDELRMRMGRAARDRIVREFTLNEQAQSFADMLESVVLRAESANA